MKKFIINILLFIAFASIIDFAFGRMGDYLQENAKGGPTRALNDLVMKDRHDVIILGSSRAHHHYDAPFLSDTLGLDVYNAGYDGNGIVLAYGLTELILSRYSPKLIIYDVTVNYDLIVNESDDGQKRYISNLKPYYRNSAVANLIKDVSFEEWCKLHSGLLRYNSNLIPLIDDYRRGGAARNAGYIPLSGSVDYDPQKESYSAYSIDDFKLKYIERLILLAQSSHTNIVFILSPFYGYVSSDSFTPISSICQNHNVPFLDYYNHPYFLHHKDLFKDKGHLNSDGARLFSTLLLNDLTPLLNPD